MSEPDTSHVRGSLSTIEPDFDHTTSSIIDPNTPRITESSSLSEADSDQRHIRGLLESQIEKQQGGSEFSVLEHDEFYRQVLLYTIISIKTVYSGMNCALFKGFIRFSICSDFTLIGP